MIERPGTFPGFLLRPRNRRQITPFSPADKRTWRQSNALTSVLLLLIAVVAGVLGFGGIAGTASGIAQILFFVFLVLFLVSLLFGGIRRPLP